MLGSPNSQIISVSGGQLINNLNSSLPSTHTFQGLRLGHPWRAIILPTTGLPGGSDGKESACNARDLSSSPG